MNYVGAPALAALAAYRVGAGLVTLAVPQAIHAIVACQVVEATHIVLPHNLGALVPAAARLVREGAGDCEAILVGPGLGQEPETESFLKLLLGKGQETGRRHVGFLAEEKGLRMDGAEALPPLVLDADGLNLLARTPEWWTLLPEGSVLTPHPGEMARLMGCSIEELPSDRVALATQKASEWNCIVVLKGAFTVVASPTGEVWVLPFATAALSTAGSGDVLAGAIAGLLAQGLAPDDAALCGAYLHGYAGLLAERSIGRAGTIAGDLLPLLPDALSLAGEG